MSVQSVAKHLEVLQEAGLVSRGRDAQRRRLDDVLAAMPDQTPDTPSTGAPS